MYAIQRFLSHVMKVRGIKKAEAVKLLGYRNISKGIRRFDAFMKGVYNRQIVDNLPDAFDVPKPEIDELLKKTDMEMEEKAEKERAFREEEERLTFVPHLYCRTERRIPSPIFACAILGADRMKYSWLPLNFNELSGSEQLAVCRERIAGKMEQYEGSIPTFGRIIHFVLRRYYDDVIEDREVFGIDGTIIKGPPDEWKELYEGSASLTMKGKDITRFFRV